MNKYLVDLQNDLNVELDKRTAINLIKLPVILSIRVPFVLMGNLIKWLDYNWAYWGTKLPAWKFK